MNADRVERMASHPVLASLAAFIGAGLRPTTPLARAIVVVLAAKLVAIVAVTIFLWSHNPTVAVDAAAIGRLLGPSSPP